MNIKEIKVRANRILQILQWFEEDATLRKLFNETITSTISTHTRKNTGFKAMCLRALQSRTLTIGQLRGISRMDEAVFNHNFASIIKDGLVTEAGKNLTLTEKGKEAAAWYIANPNAKKRVFKK